MKLKKLVWDWIDDLPFYEVFKMAKSDNTFLITGNIKHFPNFAVFYKNIQDKTGVVCKKFCLYKEKKRKKVY